MTERPTKSLQLVLTNDSATGRVTVDMEAFLQFSFWLAEELEDLVERWRRCAAPKDRLRQTRVRGEKEPT